jgi:hypothetical protein
VTPVPQPGSRIAIEELVLRVPGVDPTDVPMLVDDVLRRVQDKLRDRAPEGHVYLAELSLLIPQGGGREGLIEALATGIADALGGPHG